MSQIIFTLASLPARNSHFVAFKKIDKVFEYLQREFYAPDTLMITFNGGEELPFNLKSLKTAVKSLSKSISGQIVLRDADYTPKMSILFNRLQN